MQASSIIKSQKVFTGTNEAPEPLSVALSDDRILFVGPHKQAEAYIGPDTTVIDYGEALITPGLHDSHLHFFHSALYSSDLAEAYLGANEQDCVERLAKLAERRPKDSWLLTQGWREYRWTPAKTPSKHSLDAVYPDRPVAMYSGDAHTLWLNSCALERLGLTKDSQPPAGGSYDRDESGELTGIVREAAAMELMPKIVEAFTQEELKDAYVQFMQRCASFGITSVSDVSLMAKPGLDFVRDDIYQELEAEHRLPIRVHMFPTLLEDKERFIKMSKHCNSDRLKTSGFKQFFDGVSSQHTAYLKEPYTNARFEGDRGMTTVEPNQMKNLVLSAAEMGKPVRIHTIGDEAIHLALDFFEEAQKRFGKLESGQNCLEHVENFQKEDLARMAKLNVLASVQPCHITLDPGGPERDLGPERIKYMWPFKTLQDLGVKISFGTDAPVTDINSLNVLYTAVSRKDAKTHLPEDGWLPEEKISMKDAISHYTYGSAQACGRAHELGTLEAGKLADLAVFDTNLFRCAEDDIQKTQVIATYVGGSCIFERQD